MAHIVSISDLYVSTDPAETIITYSLGSCLGVTVFDPLHGVGGMIHCMLPLSKIDEAKSKINPAMFVDTGLPLLLNEMFRAGAEKAKLQVKLVGCSQLMDEQGVFKIGERNYTVARKILWKNDILIASEDIGGNLTRTVILDMDTGTTKLRISGKESVL